MRHQYVGGAACTFSYVGAVFIDGLMKLCNYFSSHVKINVQRKWQIFVGWLFHKVMYSNNVVDNGFIDEIFISFKPEVRWLIVEISRLLVLTPECDASVST